MVFGIFVKGVKIVLKIKNKYGLPRRQAGFTLIELLVVIAIIAILTGIGILVINPARMMAQSRQGRQKANVARVCEGVAACYSARGVIASCDTADEAGVNLPSGVSITTITGVVTATQDACVFSCVPTTVAGVTQTGTCYID